VFAQELPCPAHPQPGLAAALIIIERLASVCPVTHPATTHDGHMGTQRHVDKRHLDLGALRALEPIVGSAQHGHSFSTRAHPPRDVKYWYPGARKRLTALVSR
jgi:hypothetical protein